MRGSLRLTTVAGIGIYVHWTFFLLWIFAAYMGYQMDSSLAEAGLLVGFVTTLFGCIVLHELGHALMARHFGVRTRDITLLPIGGLARLERMPDDPLEEFLIALAGPAVNVVIAIILLPIVFVTGGLTLTMHWNLLPSAFLFNLMLANILLVAFNMLPAFPMDGGRVLRAFLTAATGNYLWATRAASATGQVMAGLFLVAGLWNPWLILIAIFVFFGARQESRMVRLRAAFEGHDVRSAMIVRFRALAPDTTLGAAADELLADSQQDFPVIDNGALVGILPRSTLIKALEERGRDALVSDVMRRNVPVVSEAEPLRQAFERMQQSGNETLPVITANRLVGLLTIDNIGEVLQIRNAEQAQRRASRA